MNYAIVAEGVHKTFCSGIFKKKYTHALRGVDLSVKQGEIFGLLGPNGAGKTTLLNIFSCQLIPDIGRVQIFGEDITGHVSPKLKTRLNMCSGNPNFPWSMTVTESLRFYSRLYGIPGARRNKTVDNCIEMFELGDFRNTRYDRLSSGNKQKVALAKVLINDPDMIFLDEPTIGLDPNIAKRVRELIIRMHKEKNITIMLTTHYMKEAEQLCERIAFIKEGKIEALGTSKELLDMTQSRDLEEAFLELS